jgi:pimeloyl-ACP methyl ester carboxylesterase
MSEPSIAAVSPTYGVRPPERLEAMRLTDGRTLAWAEWGPTGGLPVVFCTGAAMSRWLGFGADDLGDLGVRLLALDRPGLGASSAHPGKTLDSWADDVRELVRHNDFRDVTAVGFSQGAPFALALGGRGVAKAVALVAGQDDLAHPDFKDALHPEVAGMVAAARSDPAGFERDFAGFATAEGLWRLIVGMSAEQDRMVYESRVFGAAYRRSLEEGFVQGASGYARDLVNTFGPWPGAPEDVMVPVNLWYGARDTSAVHSPDFGATLASRLPDASRVVLADEGGSLLWTCSREILTKLKARALA